MISLYSGTPGSGKSLDLAIQILDSNWMGHPVICNFPVNMNLMKKGGRNKTKSDKCFYYVDTFDMSPDYFYEFARKFHRPGKEGQSLIVIDECAILFNSRDWQDAKASRKEWILFFQQHRKLGYDIILVAQQDRLIDKQIRAFIEYDVKHRKVNNFLKFGIGDILNICGIKIFVAVTYWYGIRTRLQARYFLFTPKYSKLYDTMQIFDRKIEAPAAAAPPAPAAGREACPQGVVASGRTQRRGRSSVKRHQSFRLSKA